MKFELAPQDKIEELQPYVDRVLDAMGFSDVLVTDESYITDFIDFTLNKTERSAEVDALAVKLGVEVTVKDFVYAVAKRLRDLDAKGRNS